MGFCSLVILAKGPGMNYYAYYSELIKKPVEFVNEYESEVNEFLMVSCGTYAHEEACRRIDFMFDLWCEAGKCPQELNKFWID